MHVPDTSTGRLRLTEYGEYVAEQVRVLAGDAAGLTQRWAEAPGREDIARQLAERGIDLDELVEPDDLQRCDPLDVLVQLAWNVAPRTRSERTRRVREVHAAELEQLSETARAVLSALLDRYTEHGIEDITSAEVLRVEPLRSLGSGVEIAREFGGVTAYHHQVDELQRWLYSA
jgi:type I restriction enzyme R subunit